MDILDRLLGHDAWTTRQILLRCRELSDEELHRAFDVGHETIYDTLVHMIANVQVWTALMAGAGTKSDRSPEVWEGLTVDEFFGRYDLVSEKFARLALRIRIKQRYDELWVDVLDDPPTSKSYGGAIAHVITHNMHHRAELLHILARLGVADLPEGDVLSWEQTLSKRDEIG